jgi:hypothetical protein
MFGKKLNLCTCTVYQDTQEEESLLAQASGTRVAMIYSEPSSVTLLISKFRNSTIQLLNERVCPYYTWAQTRIARKMWCPRPNRLHVYKR